MLLILLDFNNVTLSLASHQALQCDCPWGLLEDSSSGSRLLPGVLMVLEPLSREELNNLRWSPTDALLLQTANTP